MIWGCEFASVPIYPSVGFNYPQEVTAYKRRGGYNHLPYLTSVAIIEALTGLDFFPTLSDEMEEQVERVIQISVWDCRDQIPR